MIDWDTAQITVRVAETTTGQVQELVITLDQLATKLTERMLTVERLQHDRDELDRARRFLEAATVSSG